jgi:hypothetical protein
MPSFVEIVVELLLSLQSPVDHGLLPGGAGFAVQLAGLLSGLCPIAAFHLAYGCFQVPSLAGLKNTGLRQALL